MSAEKKTGHDAKNLRLLREINKDGKKETLCSLCSLWKAITGQPRTSISLQSMPVSPKICSTAASPFSPRSVAKTRAISFIARLPVNPKSGVLKRRTHSECGIVCFFLMIYPPPYFPDCCRSFCRI